MTDEAPKTPWGTPWARAAQWIGGHASEILVGRMSQWLWITVVLLGLIFWINAALLGPILKVLAKMTLAGSVGYAIDRTAFRADCRPHVPLEDADALTEGNGALGPDERLRSIFHLHFLSAAYQVRRALIIAACVVGSTLGL